MGITAAPRPHSERTYGDATYRAEVARRGGKVMFRAWYDTADDNVGAAPWKPDEHLAYRAARFCAAYRAAHLAGWADADRRLLEPLPAADRPHYARKRTRAAVEAAAGLTAWEHLLGPGHRDRAVTVYLTAYHANPEIL